MAFNLEITAQFQELFTQLNKVTDFLKQVQIVSRAASEQIQNDFKKSAAGTAQFSDSTKSILSVLGSLTSALGGLSSIGTVIEKDANQFNKFSLGVNSTIDQIKFLSDAVLQQASLFTDASDEKQVALQKEVQALKSLQEEANKSPENAKQFTQEITTQITKVHELTEEIKKTVFPEQTTSFQKVADDIEQIKIKLAEAREIAKTAFEKGNLSQGFIDAKANVESLEQELLKLQRSLSGIGDIASLFDRGDKTFNQFVKDVQTGIQEVNSLSNSVVSAASRFTDLSDEKQVSLQREVEVLKSLQTQLNQHPESAKIFTDEIALQIIKVRELTDEVKKTVIPVQENPFEASAKSVQSLRNEILKSRDDAESARKKFGEISPEFKKADDNVKALERSMKALMLSSSGISLTGGSADDIKNKITATGEFNQAIIESISNINKQADAVIIEAGKFSQFTDEKNVKLQEEVRVLQDLQAQYAKPQNVEQVKQTTAEIEKQTSVVKSLTEELQKTVIPDQGDPFQKSTSGVISLRTQIQNARQAADLAANTYGEWSPQFAAATQRLALLQNRLDQINKTAQAFNPEARLQGITNVVRGSLGGFNAVVAAMGLFGEETEDAQKALLKVQQLMLFTQGINEVLQLGTGFKALALQLGLTQTAFSGTSAAQEALSVSTAADSATITSGTKDLLKLATGQETVRSAIDKLKITKAADNIITDAGAVSQGKAAAATGANVAAQRAQAASLAQVSAAARANAVSQAATAGATGAAGGAATGAAAAFAKLWAVMLANPLIAALTGVLAIAAAILYFSEQTDEAVENQIKLNEAENEQLKTLHELTELSNKSARAKIENSENEIKIAQAQGVATEVLLQKEIKLAFERRLLALNNIESLGLTKQRLGELEAEYESSIKTLLFLKSQLRDDPGNDDIEKRIKKQEGITANLDLELKKGEKLWDEYNAAVTDGAVKTAEQLKQIDTSIFNTKKANLEAQIALDKAGSTQKMQNEIALAKEEKDFSVKKLNDDIKSLQEANKKFTDEKTKLIADTEKQINQIRKDLDKGLDAPFTVSVGGIQTEKKLLKEKLDNLIKYLDETKKLTTEETDRNKIDIENANAEIKKLTNETTRVIIDKKIESAVQLINAQKQIDESNLISIQQGGLNELGLRNNIIEQNAEAEIKQLDLTAREKANIEDAISKNSLDKLSARELQAVAIRTNSENQQNENLKQFKLKSARELNEIEAQTILTKLAVVEQGSIEELQLNKDSIDNQQAQDISAVQNSTDLAETKEKKILLIREKANADKLKLQKEFDKEELDRATKQKNALLALEISRLSAKENDPLSDDTERIETKEKRLLKELELINNQDAALEKQLKNGIISKQQYADAIIQIDQDLADKQDEISANVADKLKNRIQKTIDFAKAVFPGLPDAAGAALDKLGKDVQRLIADFKNGSVSFKKMFKDIADALSSTTQIVTSLLSQQVEAQLEALEQQQEATEQQISNIASLIAEKENQIESELELNRKGLANNLTLKRQELAELNRQKEEALKKDKEIKAQQIKLQREQIQINAIMQSAQLLLAAANILASFSAIPFGIGILLAAGVIAAMYAIFSNAKSKADSLSQTTLESGGDIKIEGRDYGKIRGKRHTQGGHNIEGTNLNVEDGEYLSHRQATENYHHWLTGANKNRFSHITFDDIISLPGISFPELSQMKQLKTVHINQEAISNITENKTRLRTIEIRNAYQHSNEGVEKRLDKLNSRVESFEKKFTDKPDVNVLPDGRIMIVQGNTTKVITPQKND